MPAIALPALAKTLLENLPRLPSRDQKSGQRIAFSYSPPLHRPTAIPARLLYVFPDQEHSVRTGE